MTPITHTVIYYVARYSDGSVYHMWAKDKQEATLKASSWKKLSFTLGS